MKIQGFVQPRVLDGHQGGPLQQTGRVGHEEAAHGDQQPDHHGDGRRLQGDLNGIGQRRRSLA